MSQVKNTDLSQSGRRPPAAGRDDYAPNSADRTC